ncbi:RCC1 domain-containing protein 1-like [Uloborus diversus]|uniref:RCC1 domain-containing protein 1-like n=1 Tax=Uloborus diversus TaxID=327109 RepID=UPI002409866C|nr:RCC1 domain-containing protein 1-like [Uloborus diversus]
MSEKLFFYFGDNLFKKLDELYLDFDVKDCQSSFYKAFNSLKNNPHLPITNVYLGWSFLLLNANEQIFRTGGFGETEQNSLIVPTLQNISNISCGLDKILLKTINGDCYYGLNGNFKPKLIKFATSNVVVQQVCVGDVISCALSSDGEVFSVCFDEKFPSNLLPMRWIICEVACGKEHVLLLSDSGQVISFGNGSRGQLGHGNIENIDAPKLLESLDGIVVKNIAAGGWHSAAISGEGDLYMWGWNESGQLGFPCNEVHEHILPKEEIETICCLPKFLEFQNDNNVLKVSCGSRHTACITEDHQVWTWGWNGYGQLGHEKQIICDKPEKISLPENVVPEDITCNLWSTLVTGTLKK